MIPTGFPKPKPKESEDCEIEIKNTKAGKKIRFRGKCSKEQIRILSKENGIEVD